MSWVGCVLPREFFGESLCVCQSLCPASALLRLSWRPYATAGQYYKTGGETYAGTLHLGTKIGDGGFITFYAQKIGTAFLTDLEAKYSISDALEFSVGANNVFNKRPPIVALVPGTTTFQLVNGGNLLDAPLTFSPFGINGGYYYARMNVSF